MLAIVSAAPHAMSSFATLGEAARKSRTEPPVIDATRTPRDAASARPSSAWPRIIRRSRQSMRELNRPVARKASRSDGAVSRPSIAVSDEQYRQAEQGWEEPEIGVLVPVVVEGLDSYRTVWQVQVAPEHGSCLEIVEIVGRQLPQGVCAARPEIPENP